MSQPTSAHTAPSKWILPVKLEDSSHYPRWHSALQDLLFRNVKIPSIGKITSASTLDRPFFKKYFKEEFDSIVSNSDDADDPDEPLDNTDFVNLCLDHAVDTGKGFLAWVYDAYPAIRSSLGLDVFERTSACPAGDIVTLMQSIKLSIGYLETHDPVELEALFLATTMESEGGNDIMKYLTLLRSRMRRLSAPDYPVPDEKCRRTCTLLRGLEPTIYSNFIDNAERTPYASYNLLEAAVLKNSSKPRMQQKLLELRPGNNHSTMTTRSQATKKRPRVDEYINAASETPDDAITKATLPCFQYTRMGTCDKGDKF